MDVSTINNGMHSGAERPAVSSPVDRMPSSYFPFPLPGADSPFFPPTAEALMQAAAAAAAAVGRQVPAADPPSLGTRSAGLDAPQEEQTRRGLEPSSPSDGDQLNRTVDDEEDDAMSVLSCAESEDTASPDSSPAGTVSLVGDASTQRRAASDVEMIAS